MEAVLRAVADESRRTLLKTLAGGPATAGDLAAMLPIARPGVSRHLRVLREAGLVDVRRRRSAGSTSSGRRRWPRSMTGWVHIGSCGSSGWMHCTPRSPVANANEGARH